MSQIIEHIERTDLPNEPAHGAPPLPPMPRDSGDGGGGGRHPIDPAAIGFALGLGTGIVVGLAKMFKQENG